jgi:Ca2+-binding EF-hand superfamily protein
MERFDSNNDGKISPEEIKAQGCSLNMSLFKVADKDGDGFLNIREARKSKKTAFRGC